MVTLVLKIYTLKANFESPLPNFSKIANAKYEILSFQSQITVA